MIVGGEDDRRQGLVLCCSARQVIERYRESGPAPAGLAAEIRCEDAGRTLLLQGRVRGEDHVQHRALVVACVEKGQRKPGQIILHAERLLGHRNMADPADVDPQGAVGRFFADVGVVPDKLQPYTVEVTDQARVERHLASDLFAQLVFLDRQHIHQHIVEVDAQVRQGRDQGGGRGVFQLQFRIAGDAVAAHGEFDLIGVVRTQQQSVSRAPQLREAALHIPTRHDRDGGSGLRYGGGSRGRLNLQGLRLGTANGQQHQACQQGFLQIAAHDALTGREEREETAFGKRGT